MDSSRLYFYRPKDHRESNSSNHPPLRWPPVWDHGFGSYSMEPMRFPRPWDHGFSGSNNEELRSGRQESFPAGAKVVSLGWNKDLMDMRDIDLSRSLALADQNSDDLDEDQKQLLGLFNKLKKAKGTSHLLSLSEENLPETIDLTKGGFFTEVENQGRLSSCTANAVIGLVEYLIKRSSGKTIDLSRIFLYKVTRNLLDSNVDKGAYIRTTIKAMKMFGVPPTKWWPYFEDERYNTEPDAFIYSMAESFKTISYLRLDGPQMNAEEVLKSVKSCLADGFPAAFGFTVYPSISQVTSESDRIPVPDRTETPQGGHAVLAVGYDDEKQAVLIRNSWGADWGNEGYAWLPYEYVLKGAASDFWTIFSNEWLDISAFE